MSFNIYKIRESKRDRADILKNNWRNWKALNTDTKTIFFPITKDFEHIHLKDISGGACKLYIFLGLKSGEYGHSWYSVDSMAQSLGVTSRTIDKWIQELEDRGLITRDRHSITSTTYLLPYSVNIIDMEIPLGLKNGNETLNRIIDRASEEMDVVGPIYRVYHLFQWEDYRSLQTTQCLLVITAKQSALGNTVYTAYSVIDHVYDSEYVVDMVDIANPRKFQSWITSNNVDVIGMALEKGDSLFKKRFLKDAVTQLSEIPTQMLNNINTVQLKRASSFENIQLNNYNENYAEESGDY